MESSLFGIKTFANILRKFISVWSKKMQITFQKESLAIKKMDHYIRLTFKK